MQRRKRIPPTPPAPLENIPCWRFAWVTRKPCARLPRPRLIGVLGRYREQLDRACKLYNAHPDPARRTSLVVFNAKRMRQDEADPCLLCCGELLRVLVMNLWQVEIADTGILDPCTCIWPCATHLCLSGRPRAGSWQPKPACPDAD